MRLVSCLVVAIALLAPAFPVQAQTGSVKIMVLGETHGTEQVTKDLVKIAQTKGAVGCVCPGDFVWGDSSGTPSAWKSMMSPFMDHMLPAQGNHDADWSNWKSLFPGERPYYAEDVNGVQFIALNIEQASLAPGSTQRTWLEARLGERDASALKVLYLHRPWWLPPGSNHPFTEFEYQSKAKAYDMDALVKEHGVDLVIAGHEKNYQHSVRGGIDYVIAGGGGPKFYELDYDLPGAVKRVKGNVVSTLDVSPTSLAFKSYDRSWAKIEEFTISADAAPPSAEPAPTTPPSLAFDHVKGNEWWVEVKVTGTDAARVAMVEARDHDSAWKVLTLRSWGPWAGSPHIEPGNTVRFRATLTDGRIVESCEFSHPAGDPLCATSSPGPAREAPAVGFDHLKGNEWWVEVKLTGADASTVNKVEARDEDTAWKALALKSWGPWAGSLHIEPGHTVRFRATLADGRTVESCDFAHPAGTC